MNYSKLHMRKRMVVLFLIVVSLMFGLFFRLIWVQVVTGADFEKKALEQRLREMKLQPKRGIIYDRNGEKLAISGTAETVEAVPAEIKNPEETAKKLSQILTKTEEEIYKRITLSRASVYVERKISDELAAKVRALNLPGIYLTEESKRYYPNGELACHLLGFAGMDSDGLEGLEVKLDHYLRGVPGRVTYERDALNKQLPNGIKKYFPPKDGYNVYLTIDMVIQYIAERELDSALTNIKARGGTVIVMNPETGEILALANRPAYNPNYFDKYSTKLWRNIAISDTYEPGSTFKVITTVAALEEGVVNVNDHFFCKGSIVVSGETIHCWKDGGHGSQSFAQVVENSCNPGFVQVGQRLGAEALYKYIDAFGFDNKTGIDLPGEAMAIKYDVKQVGPVELATTAFGHSISVTPIQLITAISAVANDGLLVRPQLVKEVIDSEGNVIKPFEVEPIRQVISQETARLGRQLLSNVVAEGTGQNAQIKGYEIGGKTGTAQAYGLQEYDSSFIGFVPVDDPKLVILVVLHDITSYPYFGSQTAAPIFQKIAQNTLRHLKIPPKHTVEEEPRGPYTPKKIEVPDMRNLPIEEAREALLKKGFEVRVEGLADELVVDQVPKPGAIMLEQSTVVLFTQDGLTEKVRYRVTVPDLTGMTVEEAAQLLAELGLKIQYSSKVGTITKQVPVSYTQVESGAEIKVFVK